VVLASYGPHDFLGEMGLLTGQHAYLTAVAGAAGRVLRIPPDQVQIIMAQDLARSEPAHDRSSDCDPSGRTLCDG
jgi:thioredoxin reductase (NADPH)